MEKILALDEQPLKEALREHLMETRKDVVDENGFLYAKGDVPVLLIAHLDTVHKCLSPPICWSKDGRFIMSPNGIGGDDRCGVYMILQIIKELNCHVLFCEQEEVGCVGAKLFCKSEIIPDVNYIIEFDRKDDNDAVYYDCSNTQFEEFITSVGFKTQWGSCSDISHIAPYIGVAAVNLSSGYFNPHSLHEFIDMFYVEQNIERAKELIRTDSKTRYAYEKKKYGGYQSTYSRNSCNVNKAEKNKEKKTERTRTRGNVIITRLLMEVFMSEYWIYESTWGDCPITARYYIDCGLNSYIEYDGVFEIANNLKIYDKTTMMPPEFIPKKAKLHDVNFDNHDESL